MHCKKCDAVFFMDKSGKIVLGDPDIVLKKAKKEAAKSSSKGKGKKKGDQEITSFTQLLLRLPNPVKAVLAGLILIGVMFGAGFRLPRLYKSLPTEVPDLAGYAVTAWVDEKVDDLKRIAAEGTDGALKTWYDEIRPKFEFKGPQDPKIGHMVQIVQGDVKDEAGQKMVVVNVYDTPPEPPAAVKAQNDLLKEGKRSELRADLEAGYKWNGAFTLPLVFTSADGEKWRFDPQKSLEVAQPKPKETPKKKR
jgi:hypothetical protein